MRLKLLHPSLIRGLALSHAGYAKKMNLAYTLAVEMPLGFRFKLLPYALTEESFLMLS